MKKLNFLSDWKWIVTYVAMIVYFPLYVFGWCLHKVARVLLALSYFALLDFKMGYDVLKYMFDYYGRHR